MNGKTWRANSFLLLTALIWGIGFVAQQVGANRIGPMTFNAVRFGLGGVALLALYPFLRRFEPPAAVPFRQVVWAGIAAGLVLFIASTFQTVGIKYTSVGKTSFITGLYVVFVPLLGLFWRQRSSPAIWAGGALSLAGLYFLSVNGSLRIERGDLLVTIGAVFWAAHVQLLAYLARRLDPLRISIGQMLFTALCSLPAGLLLEPGGLASVGSAYLPILYGGLLSVGVAFTLQIIGQRDTHPGHAAIILVSESLFGTLAGWVFLGERLGVRELGGCALILAGMLISQAGLFFRLSSSGVGEVEAGIGPLPEEKAGF